MRNALVRHEVEFGNYVYSVYVPARLVKNYQAALVKKAKKDVRLEDVTPELSNKAYEEIKHVDY